jgi:hypothetical protein
MAKIADVFGRFEAFCLSILIYILGYIQMAGSTNVQTYASAQIFYSAGSTGLQILQQVFIADSSDLLNRAFLTLLPEFPFLVTVWLGPTIAGAVLRTSSWRWGYGMWAIILPASFLPLALTLLFNQRKAQRLNLIKKRTRRQTDFVSVVRRTWYDLDVGGLALLSAAVTLILVPLTLAATAKNGWKNVSYFGHDRTWCCLPVSATALGVFTKIGPQAPALSTPPQAENCSCGMCIGVLVILVSR